MAETGHFAALWIAMAKRLKLDVDVIPGDWRHGADPAEIEARLTADKDHAIRAVMVVHIRDLDRRHQPHPGCTRGR